MNKVRKKRTIYFGYRLVCVWQLYTIVVLTELLCSDIISAQFREYIWSNKKKVFDTRTFSLYGGYKKKISKQELGFDRSVVWQQAF